MKILFGVDDSPCSRTAIEFVKQMPWARAASWELLSVVQSPALAYAAPELGYGAEVYAAVEAQLTAQRERLSRLERDLIMEGFRVRADAMEAEARTALVDAVRERAPDLLVVGSHGRSGLSRLLLGSVASHLVVHAPCNVLVVKSPVRPLSLRTAPMRILIGVDDSPCSRDAVAFVRGLAWPTDARVHVLSAVPPATGTTPVIDTVPIPAALEETRRQQELVSRYERSFVEAGFLTHASVPAGDPRLELERAADAQDADLVVVGSHGRSGLSKLVLGSVAAHIVSHVPNSVLVVKRAAALRAGPATP